MLQHLWDFETPDTYNDKVGTAHGSVTSNTTVTTGAGYTGSSTAALVGNPSNQDQHHIAVNNSNLFVPGTNAYSASLWVKLPNDNTTAAPDSIRGIFDFSGNAEDGLQLFHNDQAGAGLLIGRVDGLGADNLVLNTNFSIEDGLWHAIAINFEPGGDFEIYVDNVLRGSMPVPAAFTAVTFGTSWIGNFNFVAGSTNLRGLDGSIDDLALYSGILSPSQIAGLADGSLAPRDIPEPSSVVMMMIGIAGLAFARRYFVK